MPKRSPITPTPSGRSIPNRLLAALPAEDYERLAPSLKTIPLTIKQVLHRRGQPIRYVYFPNGAVCSFTTVMTDGKMIEVATVGDEGMVGIKAFYGEGPALSETFVQTGQATAMQMSVEVFRRELKRHGALDAIIRRYAQAFMAAMMQCIACNALHSLQERYCRWLLMTHDRVHEDEFGLSQEFLAIMVGARRPTISSIASRLQKAGVIRYKHGRIRILNRRALETESCECYAAIRREFEQMS